MHSPKSIAHLACLLCAIPLAGFSFTAHAQTVNGGGQVRIKVLVQGKGLQDGYACNRNGTTMFSVEPCGPGTTDVTAQYATTMISTTAPAPDPGVPAQNPAAPNPQPGVAQQAQPKPAPVTGVQLLGRLALVVLGIVAIIWVMKFVTKILETGRNGVIECAVAAVVAVIAAVIFDSASWTFGLGHWPLASVFGSAFVYMWLFKTDYFKGVLIGLMCYGIFISLLSMLTMKLIGHPLMPWLA